MANDKSFKIKNGLSAGRYLGTNGTETAGSEGYNLSSASYDSVSFSVAAQETGPFDVEFKPDGTKMYVIGFSTDAIYQYSLSTAFDISTASYDSVSFSIATEDTVPYGLIFKPDGTKMYMSGGSSDSIHQYSLSTAWDLSTASYDSVSFSTATQDTQPYDFAFNSDGTKVYLVAGQYKAVYQYSLSTAYDLSTISYDNVSFNVLSQASNPYALVFKPDGTKMFILGGTSDSVYSYSLSTAFDISTASYNNVSFNISAQEPTPYGLALNDDGSKMYLVGAGNDTIYQYSTVGYTQTLDLSTGHTFSFTPSGATTVLFSNPPASGVATGFTVEVVGDGSAITWPSSVKWHLGTAPTATASKEVYTFITTDGGTTYYGKKAGENLA